MADTRANKPRLRVTWSCYYRPSRIWCINTRSSIRRWIVIRTLIRSKCLSVAFQTPRLDMWHVVLISVRSLPTAPDPGSAVKTKNPTWFNLTPFVVKIQSLMRPKSTPLEVEKEKPYQGFPDFKSRSQRNSVHYILNLTYNYAYNAS